MKNRASSLETGLIASYLDRKLFRPKPQLRPVTNNLTLWLDAGNPLSYIGTGTTWTDLAGVVNGTLTNGPTFDTAYKGRILLDGSNDFVSIPYTSSPFRKSSAITYECWIYLTASVSKNIMGTSVSGGGGSGAIALSGTNSPYFYWTPSNPGSDRTANATLSSTAENTWKHLTFTMNFSGSGTPQWYENAIALTTTYSSNVTTASPATQYNQNIDDYVGGWYVNSATYFQGNIAIVRMYDIALTQEQVLNNFNVEKHRFGY
jgi:hypothetical protein